MTSSAASTSQRATSTTKGSPASLKTASPPCAAAANMPTPEASIGSKQRSYTVSWLTPYFRDTLWRVGFDVSETHSTLISKDYDIDTIGFSLYASYPLNYYWTFGTKYRFRNSQIARPQKLLQTGAEAGRPRRGHLRDRLLHHLRLDRQRYQTAQRIPLDSRRGICRRLGRLQLYPPRLCQQLLHRAVAARDHEVPLGPPLHRPDL